MLGQEYTYFCVYEHVCLPGGSHLGFSDEGVTSLATFFLASRKNSPSSAVRGGWPCLAARSSSLAFGTVLVPHRLGQHLSCLSHCLTPITLSLVAQYVGEGVSWSCLSERSLFPSSMSRLQQIRIWGWLRDRKRAWILFVYLKEKKKPATNMLECFSLTSQTWLSDFTFSFTFQIWVIWGFFF